LIELTIEFRLGHERRQIPGLGLHLLEKFTPLLPLLPVPATALLPFGQILLADGLVVEVGGKDGPGLGQGIQPGDELFAQLVIVQAAVELLLNGLGQTGDFSIASHNLFYDLLVTAADVLIVIGALRPGVQELVEDLVGHVGWSSVRPV
jgi:hypothetical protein